jgi:hypothetical protein
MRATRDDWFIRDDYRNFQRIDVDEFIPICLMGVLAAIPWPAWMIFLMGRGITKRYTPTGRLDDVIALLILDTRADRKAKRLKSVNSPLEREYGP